MAIPDSPTAGELFIAGFEGTAPSPEILSLIRDSGLGGVILYGRNCSSPEGVAGLTASLQAAAAAAGRPPLLIAIDQEQGDVVRISEGVTLFPAMPELARLGDPDIVRQVARAVSRELLALGINWNLAPVTDVPLDSSCPVARRSFGREAAPAASLVRAFVAGAEDAGMASCLKHFPGHGGVCDDSHVALPVDRRTARDILDRDLLPFREGIAAGVPAVMTAHVTFPAMDADEPATFSPAIVERLLRRDLAFDGVVVSDDLEMAGAAGRYGLADASIRALAAGVDLLIVSGMILPERNIPGLIDEVEGRMTAGTVSRQRVDDAARRVEKFKRRYRCGQPLAGADVLRCREHLALLAEIRERLDESSGP